MRQTASHDPVAVRDRRRLDAALCDGAAPHGVSPRPAGLVELRPTNGNDIKHD